MRNLFEEDNGDWLSQIKKIGTGLKPSESYGVVNTRSFVRCYELHPPLKIGKYVIYGGNCSHPKVKDADVYVATDGYGSLSGAQPWDNQEGPLFTKFDIADMCAPSDPARFKKMIEWLAAQLIAGKKCHVGCMGGHGRTGTVLSALVKHMTGEEDATEYVRKNYCHKAVESQEQIEFLHKHFGITKASPTKSKAKYLKDDDYSAYAPRAGYKPTSKLATSNSTTGGRIAPVVSTRSMWGLTKLTNVLY